MKRKCPSCDVTTFDTEKYFKCGKCGWENKVGVGWHLLNKESTPKGSKIYIKDDNSNVWIGIRKFPNGWQIAKSSGLQPEPFKNKAKAIKYMNDWMRNN
jgi:hypothetical protein